MPVAGRALTGARGINRAQRNGKLLVDQRKGIRKVMRGRAMLMLDGTAPVHARTFDVGLGGVSLKVVDSVCAGEGGLVSFEVFVGGKLDIITTRIVVAHCVCGSEGFKVGLQFERLDESATAVIVNYLRRDWPRSARSGPPDPTSLPFRLIIHSGRMLRHPGAGAKQASSDS